VEEDCCLSWWNPAKLFGKHPSLTSYLGFSIRFFTSYRMNRCMERFSLPHPQPFRMPHRDIWTLHALSVLPDSHATNRVYRNLALVSGRSITVKRPFFFLRFESYWRKNEISHRTIGMSEHGAVIKMERSREILPRRVNSASATRHISMLNVGYST